MQGVLSDKSLELYNENGFVRTGIVLPGALQSRILDHFYALPPSSTNWGLFRVLTLQNHPDRGMKGLKSRASRSWKSWRARRRVMSKIYDKSIYGSSPVLKPVLEHCLANGLASHLGDIPLLVGHDIFLECTDDKETFGFHEDGFGWEIFYQTEDDVTLYFPLCELSETTGGRLKVDTNPTRHFIYSARNLWIQQFAKTCREMGATDELGRVTRESVQTSPNRKTLANELEGLLWTRGMMQSMPDTDSLQPIDSEQGELIIFNNKRYHDIEPWKSDGSRLLYIVRCIPLYDTGLAPPTKFLNDAPCNRYLLKDGRVTPCDLESSPPRPVPIPAPSATALRKGTAMETGCRN